MTKLYRKLTQEQKRRGVIFTSTLSTRRTDDDQSLRTHEVLATDPDKWEVIERLKDDSFFNGSLFKYNIIRN